MLITFTTSNFLSFDAPQTLSLEGGKARKHSSRIYTYRKLKLVKCQALFGANASGKSNLVAAMQFMQQMVTDDFPQGFTDKYYRLNEENKFKPSEFEAELICSEKRLRYGFSVILSSRSIVKEWLYEITPSGIHRYLFERNVAEESFMTHDYFKNQKALQRLAVYGADSACDEASLFLTIINQNKDKMYSEIPEMAIFQELFLWFAKKLNVSIPDGVLTGYSYFDNSNLEEIADFLNALGTGITKLRIVEVPIDVVKKKVPEGMYNNIVEKLEKENAPAKREKSTRPFSIVARAYKEFYTFEMDPDNNISIHTIEFSHENESVYFSLREESDGTARLLDLIEILFRISDNSIYVIDEIDRCLHPAMTSKIIELFLELAEKRNTQLIITTHEDRLLKEDILRNDEISFMLKQDTGSTLIQSLEKYQLRSDKKVYEALFDGTINAIPVFNEKKMEIILDLEK